MTSFWRRVLFGAAILATAICRRAFLALSCFGAGLFWCQ